MTHPAPLRRRRLPARYANVASLVILSIMMTCIVSSISTMRSIGVTPDFFSVWPSAWLISWCVAFPTLLVVTPLVRRIVAAIVEPAAGE